MSRLDTPPQPPFVPVSRARPFKAQMLADGADPALVAKVPENAVVDGKEYLYGQPDSGLAPEVVAALLSMPSAAAGGAYRFDASSAAVFVLIAMA